MNNHVRQLLDEAIKGFICIFSIAVAWVFLFKLNGIAFSYLAKSKFISWVFLPAGLRLVAVLLFGLYGVMGLFFGAMVTGLPLGLDTQTTVTISLISAVNPYLAINTTKYCLKIDRLMTGLNAKQLLSISFFAALFNGLSHNLYFHTHIHESTLGNCFTMFIGDFLGALILLYAFALGIKLLRRTVKVQSNPVAK